MSPHKSPRGGLIETYGPAGDNPVEIYNPELYFAEIRGFPFPQVFRKSKVWEALTEKRKFLKGRQIGKGTRIGEYCVIEEPVYIGENCRIGPYAKIRKGTIICDNAVIGGMEVKDSIIFPRVKAKHHGYIGDSIIGSRVNIGAGVVFSGYKDGKYIEVTYREGGHDRCMDTGLTKFGAVVGDGCSIGSGCVFNPGTLIGKDTMTYPLSMLRGCYREKRIVKHRQSLKQVKKDDRDLYDD